MCEELVNALRRLSDWSIMDYEDNLSYANQIAEEAADAIEELSQIAAHHEQKAKDYWQEACEYREQIAHLVKEQAALFEPALKSLELSKRPYVLEAPQPRWISVKEQLPEKRKYVLVRYKNNDMAVACWFDGDENILFWRAMTDEGWCADCDTDPTHWMPLPEPPKEET